MTTTDVPATPRPTDPPPTIRSRGAVASDLAPALRSEWIKASSIRSTRTVLGLTAVGGLLVSWATGVFVTDQVQYVAEVGFFWTSVSSMLAAITGVLLFGSEVQHGTLAVAVAAQPSRWVLAAAKTAAAAVLGLAIGAVGLAAGFGGAVLAGLDAGDTSALPTSVAWALLFSTLAAVLGLGVGMVVRHSTAGIAGLLVWGFVVENLFTAFLAEEAVRFLPFFAGNHLLAYNSDLDSAWAIAIALSRLENALVFGGYTAAALALGTALLYRRDIE